MKFTNTEKSSLFGYLSTLSVLSLLVSGAVVEVNNANALLRREGSDKGPFQGDATFYNVEMGVTSCGFKKTNKDYVGAMNAPQYGEHDNPNNAEVCNKCVLIKHNDKSVKVTIVDKCPECEFGSIDLSPAAFKELAPESAGRIKMEWDYVKC
ncbi:Papain inhibitor [Zancudomyces culisetae]|uniref:Papain inhibitor n=1 Tax=Zancudomyces culisetae TaxID=1213189 RepID=A0A1R1PE75_ZANCU|nr:Papain inhibitor [Zancudomyces culisetae]|eukprot:OMH79300.1 Papain inhibitor [Zancudomyces culisetae]